jgi:predicted 3-demethylubiquinone-9 3-methyltransferase (glyoxalase superfamily)
MNNSIYPCLWYDGQAKEAAEFYCGIFKNSRIISENPVVVKFEINGAVFMGLNAGTQFKFTEAISYVVECKDQEEIDYYWSKLTEGGAEIECGWLRDKYGMCWQIVPASLGKLMADPHRFARVMQVVQRSKKLNIKEMENA